MLMEVRQETDYVLHHAQKILAIFAAFALNTKMLHPDELARQAQAAYETGRAHLAAVEGFIRQILGRLLPWMLVRQETENGRARRAGLDTPERALRDVPHQKRSARPAGCGRYQPAAPPIDSPFKSGLRPGAP